MGTRGPGPLGLGITPTQGFLTWHSWHSGPVTLSWGLPTARQGH